MEGNPADLRTYIDTNNTHDHTYYGNGCPSGATGVFSPCSDNYTTTKDGEDQLIGVYYTFPASTSGYSGQGATLNANAPDTFCPLGWQLPYGGTGGDYYDQSRSWVYLFEKYNYSDFTNIQRYPISIIMAGSFRWNSGGLFYLGQDSHYKTISIKDSSTSWSIWLSSNGGRNLQSDNSYFYGGILRCVYILAIPSSTARWQETLRI